MDVDFVSQYFMQIYNFSVKLIDEAVKELTDLSAYANNSVY